MPGAETFRASADAYDRLVGRYSPQLAAALSDFAGIEPGMSALDVGCGPGALAGELVQRLGAPQVHAADPSQPFVEACRARLPDVEVVLAPAEALPFADGTFDAVLSQLVVNFMRKPSAGVREMARVARPGAIVASCVWDYAGEMTLLRTPSGTPPARSSRRARPPPTRAWSCRVRRRRSRGAVARRRAARRALRRAARPRRLPRLRGPVGAASDRRRPVGRVLADRSTTSARPRCARACGAASASTTGRSS